VPLLVHRFQKPRQLVGNSLVGTSTLLRFPAGTVLLWKIKTAPLVDPTEPRTQ
jgi:hypothetical protein